jgi:Spy/CpxP family protein refolding chaperone
MNKLTKKQLLIGGLILLFVINIAALGTIIYQNQKYNNERNFREEEPERSWRDSRREKRYDRRMHEDRDDRSRPGRGNRFDYYLKDELNFNETQFDKFLELRTKNKEAQHLIVEKLAQKRKEMMKELSSADPDSALLKEIAKEIGDLHEDLKTKTIEHFMEVKTICNPSQKEKFNTLIRRMEKHHGPMHSPGRRPGPNPHSGRNFRD